MHNVAKVVIQCDIWVYLLLFDVQILVHEHEEDKDLHKALTLYHMIYLCVIGKNKTSTE